MKIRLQIGVTAAFTTIAVVMLGVTVAFLYESNRNLALQTARAEMENARQRSVDGLINVILPVGQVVTTTADMINSFPGTISEPSGGSVMASQIKDLSQIYGLFFGFEDDGRFFQVVQIPEGLKTFGPNNSPIPEQSRLIYRTIDYAMSGSKLDTYLYKSDWGAVIGREYSQATYDPRQRTWYEGAKQRDSVFVSPFYTFNSTNEPGVTFAKRVMNPDGSLMGVVGVDLTLKSVTKILGDIRIGEEGRVFMLDLEKRVLAYNGPYGSNENETLFTIGNRTINDPIVSRAITHWSDNPDTFFEFVDETDGKKSTSRLLRQSLRRLA